MKRALGAMAANWLRRPENQEKIKRTARDVWGRFQRYRQTRQTPTNTARRRGDDTDSTGRR